MFATHHCHLVLCETAPEAWLLKTQKDIFFNIEWVHETSGRLFLTVCAKCLQPHGLKARNEEEKVHICNGKEKWGQGMEKVFL